jgi:alpha-tubulin suppressor-like RCC1 family protein
MVRGLRLAAIGSAAGSILLLAACGPNSPAQNPAEDGATPTVWELPPAFTQTLTPTVSLAPSPEISATTTPPAAQPAAFIPLAAGGNHSCAITTEGGVTCWGSNDNGQLGDGSRTDRTRPVSVKNLTVRAVAVAAGSAHTCILTEEGGVKCWGRNKNGELGDGTGQRSSEPVDVSGLTSGVVAIAAGDDHTCAVTAQGGIKCWGFNGSGQLGDGTTDSRNVPVEVSKLEGTATAVAAGTAHTCAATAEGGVVCWGGNAAGQLGSGSDEDLRTTPDGVVGLSGGITALTAKGDHTCILNAAGEILCWGANKYGQLGDGTTGNRSTPVPVTGLVSTPTNIAAGWGQTCGVLDDGSLECWGWNFYGQLGEGSAANRKQPVRVQGLREKVVAVAGGGGHTCAILESGAVFCWGLNKNGQLGNQSNLDSSLPVMAGGINAAIRK